MLRWKAVATFWSSVGLGQQVAGELLDRELVVGQVAVEGVDHPVAVPPDVGAQRVGAVARAVGVAGQVEPHAGPAFAEGGIFQEAIDRSLVGAWGLVVEKLPQLFGRGRQAAQVEAHPTQQGMRVGLGFGVQPLGFQAGQDPVVETITRPGGVFHHGQRTVLRGHERPVLGVRRFLP